MNDKNTNPGYDTTTDAALESISAWEIKTGAEVIGDADATAALIAALLDQAGASVADQDRIFDAVADALDCQ